MFRRPRRLLPFAIMLAVIAGVVAFLMLQKGGRSVALVKPELGTAIEAVYATGTVEPENWARVGPVGPGRIAEILAYEGDTVKAGQPLARLDDREAIARVAELEAKAVYWRQELERQRVLSERGIKSQESQQKARSEYESVIAGINAARQRRQDLVVTAPSDGIILRRDGEVGEITDKTDVLFWIGEPKPLRITADVDEEDIARVRPGQEVLIKADAFPDQVLKGVIDRITPKGDPINKSFRVRVRLPNDTPLLVGMTTEINVITAVKDNALLVPAGAIIGDRLFVAESGAAQPRTIKIGIKGRDRIEILQGIGPNDLVLASPPAGLKAGDRVTAER